MKKLFSLICLLLSATFLMTSCLSSEDSTYYDDTAITAFSLGTLNRYVHVKSSTGADSTYKATVTGSSYNFYIDQSNRTIYNPDSLPIWTDNSKVLCTISTKNSGVVYYKSLKSDSVFYYSTTDSIDFSTPRTLYVYSSDGTAYRAYTVHVNVHSEASDTFKWSKLATNAVFASFSGMKAFEVGGKILLFGSDGNKTSLYSTPESDGSQWSQVASNVNFDADAYVNVVKSKNTLYMKSEGKILKSTDGSNWTAVGVSGVVDKLVGASTSELYAMNANNMLFCSRDGGISWSKETLDEDSALLPARDFACYSMPLSSNDSTDRVSLVGNRSYSAFPLDTTAVVWNKIAEYSAGSATASWSYYNRAVDNYNYYLPRLNNLTIVPYDDGVLAFGGDGVGNSSAKAFSHFYQSRDNGITWKNNTLFSFPNGFSCSKTSFAGLTDSSNHLWIICGESGQVWRGRLNRLGWTTEDTSFTK